MSDKPLFTPEEISVIDKNLGFIVFDWPKRLVNHIIHMARQKGVDNLYINTTDTLNSGSNDDKADYFYNTLPERLGFQKVEADLRDQGPELLWVMQLNNVKVSEMAYNLVKLSEEEKSFTIDEIPKSIQGAVLSIIGRKPSYLRSECLKVINLLENKKEKPKAVPKFYYDWASTTWNGSQRFNDNITETAVLQRVPEAMQNQIENNPVLKKFWHFILSQPQHFGTSESGNGSDVIGFALVARIDAKNWLINEIQTDCVNKYMEVRGKYYKDSLSKKDKEKMSWETLSDMLEAQNRRKWIAKCEVNQQFKQQLLDNPNMIGQLPDDSQDIDKWIAEQRANLQNDNTRERENANTRERDIPVNPDLMRAFQSVNFNKRVFRSG